MTLHAFTDGASRGNPGDSGIGFVVKDENGSVLLSVNGYIGKTTNNVAEYTALIALLKRMIRNPPTAGSKLIVHSDSELMVRQINGTYKVKDEELKRYYKRVIDLRHKAPFEFELRHVSREQNRDADRLANVGIDTKKRIAI